jgi:DNA-binding MarR family transcriptional regulator
MGFLSGGPPSPLRILSTGLNAMPLPGAALVARPPGPPVATGDCLATDAGRLSHICKDSSQYNHPKNNVNSDVIFYVKIMTLFFIRFVANNNRIYYPERGTGGVAMRHDYSEQQLDQYLEMMDRVAGLWLQKFPERAVYSPGYWHLFMGLYKNRHHDITKGEAAEFLTAAQIKSPATRAKVIAGAIKLGYVSEQKSTVDKRANLVRMTPKLQKNIQEYLSEALQVMSEALKSINNNAKGA